MKVLNNNCRNDISDQECYHTECPEKCEQFEPVMSQELMDHYKALGEHYNNEASRIVMEAYMLGRRDAQKKRDNKVSDLIRRQAVLEMLKREEKILYTPTGMNYLIRAIKEIPSVNPQTICEEREKGECPYYAG